MKMERARITEYAEYLQETLSNNSGKLLVGTGISEEQHIKSSERKAEFYTPAHKLETQRQMKYFE
jgi:hypothetical protein